MSDAIEETEHARPPVVPARAPLVSRDLADLTVAGAVVELDPEDAAAFGAFEESALSEADAWDANADVGGAADADDRGRP